jgi:DNA-binding NtrC family response regulator
MQHRHGKTSFIKELRMNALIVDDEPDIGFMTGIILKKRGINSKNVTSIAEASIEIDNKNFGIYFLDLNLPDGTGFDLIPQIRNKDKHAGIVIISAFDDVSEAQKAAHFKVNKFIKKPFSTADILNAVDQILKN